MTVQELIDELMKIEDKTKTVKAPFHDAASDISWVQEFNDVVEIETCDPDGE
jgi:hypothetical protein